MLAPVMRKLVDFNGDEIMVVKAGDGKVYAGVRWICRGIGLSEGQYQNQTRKLNDDPVLAKGIAKMQLPTEGGPQGVLVIAVDYLPLWLAKINAAIIDDPVVQEKLIAYQLRAKDVLAEAFASPTQTFEIPANYAEALRLAANLWEENQEQKAALVVMAPKAEFYEAVAAAKDSQSFRDAAKVLGTGQNRLFARLRREGILMDDNRPYQQYVEAGYFRLVERTFTDWAGNQHLTTQTRITGKGLIWLQKRLQSESLSRVVMN